MLCIVLRLGSVKDGDSGPDYVIGGPQLRVDHTSATNKVTLNIICVNVVYCSPSWVGEGRG